MLPVTGAMASRVEVIVNCNAQRLGAASPLRRALVSAFVQVGATVHTTTSLGELGETAREIAKRGTDVVVLVGGDGSHMCGVSALAQAHVGQALPRIALFPAGTVGTVARSTGAYAARKLPAVYARALKGGSARTLAQPTLRVQDDRGGDHVAFMFGAGLVARFFEVYNASPRRGRVRAAQITARLFFGSICGSPFARHVLARERGWLSVDGLAHSAPAWSLVLASVVPDVGLHVRVAYRAREAPPRFHVVASGQSPGALGRQLPRVLAGMPLRGEPTVDALALRVEFAFDGDDGAYILDGDVLRASRVRVSPGPGLTLLSP